MRVLFVVVLLVSSIANADDKLGGNVLVWADARWYVDADDKAPSIQLGKSRELHHVVPAKFVGVKGNFVEVELQAANDCAWANATTAEITNVRLYVSRFDLAPVLAKPFRATYSDGTRIALKPGVPVMQAGDKFTIAINGDHVDVPIPAASIAFSYKSPKLATRVAPRSRTAYAVEGDATLGAARIELTQTTSTMTKRGAKALLPITAPCIDAIVAAPVAAVQKAELGFGSGIGAGKGGRTIQERWYIAKGTAMLGPSGRVVALSTTQIDVAKPADDAKDACHETEIGFYHFADGPRAIERTDKSARMLRLCVPIAQIKHENPMPARPSAR